MRISREAGKLYRLETETIKQRELLVSVIDRDLKRGRASWLARELGVTPQFLSEARKGRRRIGLPLLRELMEKGI